MRPLAPSEESEPHHMGRIALDQTSLAEDDELLQNARNEKGHERRLSWKLGLSFFLFGLINNVLYVIILSAALDLVPPSTPKGIIAFCNIAPALVAKVGWPYFLKGRIRYTKRLIGCCLLSSFGMIVVAAFDSLSMRLLGIGLASFSSGLGEITFLQLSTTYAPPSVAGRSVGYAHSIALSRNEPSHSIRYFASGTGAAGLVGAFLWWEVRSLGVRVGVGLSSVMPFIIPLTYFFLLPHSSAFLYVASPSAYDDASSPSGELALPYTPLPATEDEVGEEEGAHLSGPKRGVSLSVNDKWRLVKPLLLKYMLPLFCVYLFEYTINQGIAPTLLYPVPTADKHPLLSKLIHTIRDYYPLWQLVYQTTVFLSRSSISLGIPPLPARLLSLPAVLQAVILVILAFESAVGLVNVFYRINQERPDAQSAHDLERAKQEKEFRIGSIGFSDSFGILFASLLAVPMEVELCKAQIGRGKMLCKGL
ncbi:hypothetical protein H0H87_002139 [Tephrocybe sp. NHM501043]|nr:hypothetical protein H0H87_002139 [Tephrocybe sp. NHM501043]